MTATETCPKCNKPMVLRTKKGTDFQFYGCSGFPKCNGYKPFKAPKADRSSITLNTSVQGSPEQEAIWNTMLQSNKHLIVKAGAGCGKTFTIVHGSMLMQQQKAVKQLFVAFNTHIVKELEQRLPQEIMVKTMHSFSFQQVKRWNPRVTLDENKLDGIIDGFVPEDDNSDYIKAATRRIVELCKYNLFEGKDEQELDSIVDTYGIDLNDHRSMVYTIVPQVIKASVNSRNVVDFTDMLYFVYTHKIAIETFDVVIADELQDFNKLQQYIAILALGKTGRFFGVGDEYQSIYGFAGANTNSMRDFNTYLSTTNRGVESLPLTVSRRCAVAIIDRAQQIVPHIRAMDDAPIGIVESMGLNKAIESIKPGDMGICRRTAPLISVAYGLMRAGVPVFVKGRDFGKGMLALIKKLKAQDIPELIDKAEKYRNKELEKLEARGKKADNARQALNDKIDTLIALTEGMEDLTELRAKITTLFSDTNEKNAVQLSTIHRVKGNEADKVFIFDYSRVELPMRLEEQIAQEKHVHYVGITRAKSHLVLVD